MGAKKILLPLFAAVALIPAPLYAAHPLITEDTGTQGQGRYQLELNTEHGRERDGASADTAKSTAALSYGFRDNADVIFTLPYQRTSTETDGVLTRQSGAADAGVDIKWRFIEHEDVSLAVKLGITCPTGDENKGLGAGRTSYSMFFVTSFEHDPWAFHVHLGYLRNLNSVDERKGLHHSSFAAVYGVDKNLKLVADIGTNTNKDKANYIDPAFLIVGFIFSVNHTLDVDVGYKKELTDPELDRTLLAGLTLRF